MNYSEIKIGNVVDYHSIIGGPITKRNCLIESNPWQIGHGEWVVRLVEVHGAVSLKSLSEIKFETNNKKEIYDQYIRSHIDAIINICVKNKISFNAEFNISTIESPGLHVSTGVIEHVDSIPTHMFQIAHIQQSYDFGLYDNREYVRLNKLNRDDNYWSCD